MALELAEDVLVEVDDTFVEVVSVFDVVLDRLVDVMVEVDDTFVEMVAVFVVVLGKLAVVEDKVVVFLDFGVGVLVVKSTRSRHDARTTVENFILQREGMRQYSVCGR